MFEELRETPIERKNIYTCGIFTVDELKVRLPDGTTARRNLVNHVGGVAVVAVDDEQNVTLVCQHRIAVDEVIWEIPAGKLDSPAEDPLEAAKRELEEETGLRAGRIEKLTAALPSPGYSTEVLHLYLARDLSQHETHPDADEFLHVKRIPLRAAVEAVMQGELHDMKTVCGLLMAWEKLTASPIE